MRKSRRKACFTAVIAIFAAIVFAGCGKRDAGAGSAAAPQQQAGKPSYESADTMTVVEGYRRISADEAKKMMDGSAGVIVLDVRTMEEFKTVRIAGSVLLPVDEVQVKAASVLPDKEAVVLVYCRRGRRSKIAANMLVSMGYANVYDFGAISDWKYGVVKD